MTCHPGLFRSSLPGLASALLMFSAVACEPDAEPPALAVSAAPLEITGRYQLAGVTTTVGAPGSEQKRKIAGIMMIQQQGDHYTASFEFKTDFPGEGLPVNADVIGVGEGQLTGNQLTGIAQTQIVVSSVPGVDTGFAFIPRRVSTRIVSTSTGEFGPDGTLSLEIESRADEGQSYLSTRTRMRGKRIGDPRSTARVN